MELVYRMTKLLSDMTTKDYESFARAQKGNLNGWQILSAEVLTSGPGVIVALNIGYPNGAFREYFDTFVLGYDHDHLVYGGKRIEATLDYSRWENLFRVLINAADNENDMRAGS